MQHADPTAYRPAFLDDPRAFEGVLSRRVLASLIDVLAITFLVMVLVMVVTIATFGLGLLLLFLIPVVPLVTIVYVAKTMGGATNATWGMRMMGVRMERVDGGRVDWMLAAIHSLLFWAQFTIFAPILLLGLFDNRRRLLHDMLLGTVFVRSDTALS